MIKNTFCCRLNRGSVDVEDGKLSDKEKELAEKEAEVTNI